MPRLSENNSGNRFTGQDMHAFVVIVFVAIFILALMMKITFF
jgi:hypothetical protein